MSDSTMIGRTIDHGRYRLTRWLGGGFGDVYLAEDTTHPPSAPRRRIHW